MGKGGQTIGYRYFMAKHDGICRGPVNEFVAIQVGDVEAYNNPVNVSEDGALIIINKPNLFGGKKKEGGIVGPMYLLNGKADQVTPGAMASAVGTLPDMAATLGGDVPGFRGIFSTWYDGEICSNNPYPKEWAYRLRRWNAGWYGNQPWYPIMSLIEVTDEGSGGLIRGMNGAHILVQCNTDPQWGRGMPLSMINENSYRVAAHQLCAEGWALCFWWFRQESVRDFIQVVIDHIGGVQYVDRETGKMTLRLIRDDYDPDDLPVFGPDSGLLDVQLDDASGEETGFNEIIVTGFNPVLKKEISVRVQNIGAIQAQDGEIISQSKEFKGLPTEKQLLQIAVRELRSQIGLRKLTLEFDRRAWRLAPGMPFKINFPDKNIANMIVRPGEINEGGLVKGGITMKAVEDIFGVPLTVYVDQPTDQWVAPDYTAVPPLDSKLVEMSYRDMYLRTTEAERAEIAEGDSIVAMVAAAPVGVIANGYELATKTASTSYPDPDSVALPDGSFTAWAKLGANLTAGATTATILPTNLTNFLTEFVPGMVAMLGDEHIEIVSVDDDALTMVIRRGVADTVPAPHSLNDMIWLLDDEMVSDKIEYVESETVYGKALTQTAQDALTLAEAVEKSIVTVQRVNRPYPPGNVRVDGQSIYAMTGEHLAFVLSWAHRDRLLQMDQVVDHTEASVGPEPGTTYNVRVYAADGTTELFNDNVGNVDTWDSSADVVTTDPLVWVELESERDTLTSFQLYRFPVVLTGGWDYGWSLNWGGGA